MRFTAAEVLGEAWHLFTRHSGRLIAIAAIVFGFLSAVQALINSTGVRALIPLSVGVTIMGALWVQGALVVAVEDIRDGRVDLPLRAVFARVGERIWTLLATGVAAAVLVVLGLSLLVVPGIVLITLWSTLTPVVMLERRGMLGSFARSQRLVRRSFLSVLVVVIVTVAGATVVQAVITAALQPLPPFVDLYVAGVIASSITIPFVALAWTLAYFDLRDLERVP